MTNERALSVESRRSAIRKLSAISAAVLASPASLSPAVAKGDWDSTPLEMPEGVFVIDGVTHCYNHDLTNYRNTATIAETASYGYDSHMRFTPEQYRLSPEQYLYDWQPEELAECVFLESDTDMMCMHSVPLFTYYKDGLVTNSKGAYLKRTYPDRVFWYAAVDLFDDRDTIFRTIDWVSSQGCDGIKMYPSRINWETNQREWWFMDDAERVFPVFEYAASKGIKHIATHKLAGHIGATSTPDYMGVEDFVGAAKAFPDVWFHIVHAGMALIDETVEIMNRNPNITAVLEGPMIWPLFDMDLFDNLMTKFVKRVDADRLLYASGFAAAHPYWILKDFLNYQPPVGSGFTLTEDMKVKILGQNFAQIHGTNTATLSKAIQDDKFARIKAENGLREPLLRQRVNGKPPSGRNDLILPVPLDMHRNDEDSDDSMNASMGSN